MTTPNTDASNELELEPEEFTTCSDCRSEYTLEEIAHLEGRDDVLCENCITTCNDCSYTIPAREAHSVATSSTTWHVDDVCDSCFEDAWRCEACDTLYSRHVASYGDDGECLCYACNRERENERAEEDAAMNSIGGYHNPARRAATVPIESEWTTRRKRALSGVELEVELSRDTADERRDLARTLLEVGNASRRELFAEHDGSLEDGFELITQPMGLDLQRELWARVLSSSAVRELRSHDTTTCGLHVHISRKGLTRLQIAKVVVFLNDPRNENFVRAIARRYGTGYCKLKRTTLGSAPSSCDRYEMLNLTNSRTIEFRLFRGTLRATTLLACVEFSYAILEWALHAPCSNLTWEAFLEWCYAPEQKADTTNLRACLARRVTTRMAPRYVALRDVITRVTGKAPVAPTNNTDTARWAEV